MRSKSCSYKFNTFLTLVMISSALAFFACNEDDDKKIEPLTGSGELSLVVFERENSTTPEKEFKAQGGVVTTTYAIETRGNSMTVSKTLSFTALIKIPLQVKIEKDILSLIKLDIADGQGVLLYSLSGEALQGLKKEAKHGLDISIIRTKDNSVPQEVKISKKTTLPPDVEPDKSYVPLTTVFPDPLDIIRIADVETTLKKLREVATATEEYHKDLLKVATDAPSLDVAHLHLLLDACYFPYAFRKQMEEEYQKLWEKHDEESQKLMQIIFENINLADTLAPYTIAILNVGMSKVFDLTLDKAIELLHKLFSTGDSGVAFQYVIKLFSPLSAQKKLEFLDLALQKSELKTALDLAQMWFRLDSGKKAATLIELAKRFGSEGRDSLILNVHSEIVSLTTDELLALISLAYSRKKELALARVNEVSDFSIANAVRVIQMFSSEGRDDVAEKVMSRGGFLTTDELRSVVSAAYARRLSIARNNCGRILGLKPENVVSLAQLFSSESRDEVVLACSARLEPMTTDQLIGLVQAGYAQRVRIAKMHYLNLNDFSGGNIARIAQQFSSESKDAVIEGALESLKRVTSEEVKNLIDAAYAKRPAFAVGLAEKTTDLTAQNTADISSHLSSEGRDMFLLRAVDLVTNLNGDNAASLIQYGYAKKLEIALKAIERISGLAVSQASFLASYLSSDSRDLFLLRAADLVSDLSGENIPALIQYGYARKLEISLKSLRRLSGLGVENAIAAADSLSSDSRDIFLLEALNRLSDLSGQNILSLSQHGYAKKFQILMTALELVKTLTVNQAIMIARNLSYDAKDSFLLRAVDLVVDLSTSNLISLASEARAKKDEVIQKGLDRLSHQK